MKSGSVSSSNAFECLRELETLETTLTVAQQKVDAAQLFELAIACWEALVAKYGVAESQKRVERIMALVVDYKADTVRPTLARHMFERYLPLTTPGPSRANALHRYARTLSRQGDYVLAVTALDSAAKELDSLPANILLGDILSHRAVCLQRANKLEDARNSNRAAHAIRTKLGDVEGASICDNVLGVIELKLGNYEIAGRLFETAANAFRQTGNLLNLPRALGNLIVLLMRTGSLTEALECLDEIEALQIAANDAAGLARNWGNKGTVYFDLGDYDKALDCFEKSVQQAVRTRDRQVIKASKLNQGMVLAASERHSEAIRIYNEDGLIEKDDGITACGVHVGRAYSLAAMDQTEGAREHVSRGYQIALELNDQITLARTHYVRGFISSREGKHVAAIGDFERALEVVTEAKARLSVRGEFATRLAEEHAQTGSHELSLQHSRNALDCFLTAGVSNSVWYFRCLSTIAISEQASGNAADARFVALDAVEVMPSIGPSLRENREVMGLISRVKGLITPR